ncbi:hypothetical protein ACFQWB_11130 [Paenibacillus thermoaerophilus]|uniref:Rho termination factor, N-terminal domain n=1 Tax=Paenibacillus thermoaerophilus TaxID=1215385 RepID=A0ABW2V5X9_9BACL|nr:hypothetical protein [Paenibacillus thermoaerophilus]TMV18691.1 hypothetical protein FE781_01765 [Paenibacillus thermoaerophilus]
MDLADMLSYADIHELSRIAKTYQCECDGHSKRELIQAILSKLNRREVFESQVSGLTMEDLRFLNSILFEPRDTYSLEELIACARQAQFDSAGQATASAGGAAAERERQAPSPRETISRFKQMGWLFNGHSQQTRYLFRIPADLRRRFGDTLAEKFAGRLDYRDEPPAFRGEEGLLGSDVVILLRAVADLEPQLAADGSLYKRGQAQILERLNVPEEPLSKGGWRFGYGRRFRDYPNRFALLYDYVYHRGWISEAQDRLLLTRDGENRLADGAKESDGELYRYWLRVYRIPVYNLHSIVHWLDRLAAGRWATVESLGRLLCPLIKPFYYDSPQAVFEQRIVRMLVHLGFARLGECPDGAAVVRITDSGSAWIRLIGMAD